MIQSNWLAMLFVGWIMSDVIWSTSHDWQNYISTLLFFFFGFQLNSQNVSFYGWIPIYQSNQFVVFVFEEKILKCIFICLNIKKSEGKIHLQIVLLYVYWVWDKQMEIYRFSFLSDFTGMKVKFITPKKRILKTEKL